MKAVSILTGEEVEVSFFTSYHRPIKDESEHLPTTSKTERAYIPPEDQIKDMLRAGQALDAARRAKYDTDLLGEGEELAVDPTRGDVDFVDVQRMVDALDGRLTASEKKAAEEARKALDEAAQAKFDFAVNQEIEKRSQERKVADQG